VITVANPATGETLGTVPRLGEAEVGALVEKARAAQPGWADLGFEGRRRVLRRMQRWIVDHEDEVARQIVAETGKAYEDALVVEVAYGAAAFGFWAKRAPRWLADEKVRPTNAFVAGRQLVVRYAPIGVVGVIGPWNYPLVNSFGDCVPALAAGNAVVLKPSKVTPLTSLLLARALRECGLPEGVLEIATGDGATGAALVEVADMIMFTGSTEVGRGIAARAGARLIPVSLELGGKDPMIVLADADVDRAARAAVYGAMHNAGQTCISIERVYVERPVHDAFVTKVTEQVAALRQGPPDGPGSVDVGSLTFPPQRDIVARHVNQARAAGARVTTGGRAPDGAGAFYPPTVLADVDHSMACMTEETFGPTLPVMAVADAEEALRLANDSPYGLSASVWTRDRARGVALARRIEAGAVCVNDAQLNYVELALPMGGWKASGLGARHGPGGIRKYCRQQSLLVTRFALPRELHHFPYRRGATRLLSRLIRVLNRRGRS